MNKRNQRIEGYWCEKPYSQLSKTSNYPMPEPGVLTTEESQHIHNLILIKQQNAKVELYRGFSSSRITQEILGSSEFTTDEWRWPGDFAKHYVLDHRVKPSDEFLEYIGYNPDNTSTKKKGTIKELLERVFDDARSTEPGYRGNTYDDFDNWWDFNGDDINI